MATRDNYCLAFRSKCADKDFREKLSPLNGIELEVLSISSTPLHLKDASLYFEAEDVSDLFRFGVRDDRRRQVQRWLGRSDLHIRSRNGGFSFLPLTFTLANDAAALQMRPPG